MNIRLEKFIMVLKILIILSKLSNLDGDIFAPRYTMKGTITKLKSCYDKIIL